MWNIARRIVDVIRREFGLSVKSLRTRPGLAFLCATTLALGLGANVATFSMLSALLLKPYTFQHLERLMFVREQRGGETAPLRQVTPGDFMDIRLATGFDDWAAYRLEERNLASSESPVRIRAFAVTPNFFRLIGADLERGRVFAPAEGERTVLVSHSLWQHQLGARPDIVGAPLGLDGETYTVIGVMPQPFNFPMGADVWVPLVFSAAEREERDASSLFLLGRLRKGHRTADGRSALNAVASDLSARYPSSHRGRRFHLIPLRSLQYEYTLPFFGLLQFSALFVLALAVGNTANLVLAFRQSRDRSIAVLGAIGATPAEMARLSIIESSIVAGAACLLSLPIAYQGVELFRESMPAEIVTYVAGWNEMRLDATVFALTIGLTVTVAIAFGFATRYRWSDAVTVLRGGGARTRASTRRLARAALVPLEVALTLVLLTGAALLELGFQELEASFEVLEPDGVLTFGISLSPDSYPDETDVIGFSRELEARLAGLHGVDALGALTNLPASNIPNPSTPFMIEQRPIPSPAEIPIASLQTVAGDIFRLLRIPLVRGRYLDDTDQRSRPRAVVVSRSLARLHWPEENPIGHRLRLGDAGGESYTIVGVVGDVKQNWFEPNPPPTIYVALWQRPRGRIRWALRSALDPYAVASEVRDAVQELDPELALAEIQSLPDAIRESIAPLRIIGTMMTVFAGLAALLAIAGVYAVISAGVSERMRELGVRVALGARGGQIISLILSRTFRFASFGLALGLPATLAMNRFLAGHFFGLIEPRPALAISLAFLILGIALVAGTLPARRAARLDPIRVLRAE